MGGGRGGIGNVVSGGPEHATPCWALLASENVVENVEVVLSHDSSPYAVQMKRN